jgi:exodeoxyribonuclease III
LRVVTFSANGLRSAVRKGFFPWFVRQRAGVLCVKELKAHDAQIADAAVDARRYHLVCAHAERPGYSGVAICSREASAVSSLR